MNRLAEILAVSTTKETTSQFLEKVKNSKFIVETLFDRVNKCNTHSQFNKFFYENSLRSWSNSKKPSTYKEEIYHAIVGFCGEIGGEILPILSDRLLQKESHIFSTDLEKRHSKFINFSRAMNFVVDLSANRNPQKEIILNLIEEVGDSLFYFEIMKEKFLRFAESNNVDLEYMKNLDFEFYNLLNYNENQNGNYKLINFSETIRQDFNKKIFDLLDTWKKISEYECYTKEVSINFADYSLPNDVIEILVKKEPNEKINVLKKFYLDLHSLKNQLLTCINLYCGDLHNFEYICKLVNIAKLKIRYSEKFSSEEASFRNLDLEKSIIENSFYCAHFRMVHVLIPETLAFDNFEVETDDHFAYKFLDKNANNYILKVPKFYFSDQIDDDHQVAMWSQIQSLNVINTISVVNGAMLMSLSENLR